MASPLINSDFAIEDQTLALLKDLPGGPELLDWFGGDPRFGDAEVIDIHLDRNGPCWLRIAMFKRAEGVGWKTILVTFTLSHMVDISIEGFSHQNVIGDLAIRHIPADTPVHGSLLGIGTSAPAHEIFLEPCAGAFGSIRATIEKIMIEEQPEGLF